MTQTRPLLAALWMIGAIVSFTAMAVGGKSLVGLHDTFEIMLYRSIIGFTLVVSIGGLTGHLHEVTTRNLPLQFFRNLCHFTGQNLWFFSLGFIPLAHVFALEFTSPLWVMCLAAMFLGERLTVIKGVAAIMAFIGVLLVVHPDAASLNPGHVTAALSAVAFAVTAILTKTLTARETITGILFWLTLIQLGFGAVTVFLDGEITLPTAQSAPWIILVALAALLAHFCLTKALSVAPASVVMPMDFARLPAIAIVGFFLFSEALEVAVIFGAALILTANWLNIRASIRQ